MGMTPPGPTSPVGFRMHRRDHVDVNDLPMRA